MGGATAVGAPLRVVVVVDVVVVAVVGADADVAGRTSA
jgi:hypothetical protein